ncbi:LLM class flavin-dependent oxidoreductase, partial [Streptomyces sp. NPDC049099]|uniref:LLM class flavin-dependent oxidoreductase n=1 Tax=Streptomyces sp. NPDC049099 TaxID=3155768 RepID=UPI003438DCB2
PPATARRPWWRCSSSSASSPWAPERPHPEIFQGGNSTAARAMAGRVSDWYFSNGKDFDGVTEQIQDVRSSAIQAGRTAPKFGLNGFLIARDTEAEARETLREIVAKADTQAVHGFRDAVQQAGPSTGDGKGMWQDSTFEDLVQYNDGFRTGLIGTPEQIAERIVAYKRLGVDLFLLGFLHYLEEVEYFGKRVLPLVRELEAQEAASEPAAAHA